MRRAFHLQFSRVTAAHRHIIENPGLAENHHEERAEILFANLRKALVIEDQGEGKVLFNVGIDDAEFDCDFKAAWLTACGARDDETEIVVTGQTQCICEHCAEGYEDLFIGTAYHVHWKLGDQLMSVGVFGPDAVQPDKWYIVRARDLRRLETAADYELLMGWAIDDALHACQLNDFEDTEIIDEVEKRANAWVKDRIGAGLHFVVTAEWIERVRRVECRITINGGISETIIASRMLR